MNISLTPSVAYHSKEEKSKYGEMIYVGLTGIALLSYLFLLATGTGIDSIPVWIWMIRIITVPFAIWYSRLWKEKGFCLLLVYFCWICLRINIWNPDGFFTQEGAENILSGLWLFFGCYGVGWFLKRKRMTVYITIIASIWIVGIILYSSTGVYVAWIQHWIKSFGEGYFQTWFQNRLNLIYLATTSAAILSVSALIMLVFFFSVKSKLVKIILSISLLPVILALALTDSRTGYVSFAIGTGIIVCIALAERQRRRNKKPQPVLYVAVTITITVVIIIGLSQITGVFNRLKMRGFIPAAYAENGIDMKSIIVQRGFSNSTDVFSGRYELWQTVIEYFKNNPLSLFMGKSKISPLSDINGEYAHCHCLYIQVLLESGIPGLVMMLSFIMYTFKNSIHIIKNKNEQLWVKFLPAIVFSLCVGDLAECFIWLRTSQCIMIAVFFISSGIINNRKNALE